MKTMADYIKREDELIAKSVAKAEIEAYFANIKRIDKRRKTKIEAMRIDLLSCIGGIAPVVDVRENVPAHWVFDCVRVAGDGWTHKQRHCSNCGFQTVECVNFCQNCGADMRGEKNERCN